LLESGGKHIELLPLQIRLGRFLGSRLRLPGRGLYRRAAGCACHLLALLDGGLQRRLQRAAQLHRRVSHMRGLLHQLADLL
jgi:hypothetical protein